MAIRYFHVDAFCDRVFQGNPAMVCLLPEWLTTEQLQALAAEHHLPVTAFLVANADTFEIRWFTPQMELDLCGHGTLAAAFVLLKLLMPERDSLALQSVTAGVIEVKRDTDKLSFTFPAKQSTPLMVDSHWLAILAVTPEAVYRCDQERLMVVLASEEQVAQVAPDMVALKALGYRALIVCATASQVDFVSRTFYPAKPMPEDAVTGASHCYLAPYFAKRLSKTHLVARQVSARGGTLWLSVTESQVTISAQAVLYSEGIIHFA